MNHKRLMLLTFVLVFALACSFSTAPATTAPIQVEQATFTPYPTYTPYPTVESPVVPDAPAATATLVPVEGQPDPSLNAELAKPNENLSGNSKANGNFWYFTGQQGQRVTIILTGVDNYQTFAIRGDDNKGLIGCDIETQTICAIHGYTLPYTGLYYILVDRTDVQRYYNYCQSRWAGSPYAPAWCYMGGPYTMRLTFE